MNHLKRFNESNDEYNNIQISQHNYLLSLQTKTILQFSTSEYLSICKFLKVYDIDVIEKNSSSKLEYTSDNKCIFETHKIDDDYILLWDRLNDTFWKCDTIDGLYSYISKALLSYPRFNIELSNKNKALKKTYQSLKKLDTNKILKVGDFIENLNRE